MNKKIKRSDSESTVFSELEDDVHRHIYIEDYCEIQEIIDKIVKIDLENSPKDVLFLELIQKIENKLKYMDIIESEFNKEVFNMNKKLLEKEYRIENMENEIFNLKNEIYEIKKNYKIK